MSNLIALLNTVGGDLKKLFKGFYGAAVVLIDMNKVTLLTELIQLINPATEVPSTIDNRSERTWRQNWR